MNEGSGDQRAFHDGYHPNADDADTLDGVQGNKYFTSYNNAGTTGWEDSNRNFRINSGGDAVGFAMHESSGTFGFQLYGDGSYYGFLDGNWAGWDIQKAINGAFKVDEGSGLQRVFNDAYHPNADKWTTARTLTLAGDVTGSVSWDGSANVTLTATVADDSHDLTWANIDGETANSVNSWGGLRHQTNDGYIDFGPANSSHAHIYTDRPNFYFNTELLVNNQQVFHTGYHPNADILTTARTINGVSFNGSANITIADSTKLPLAGGTMTGSFNLQSQKINFVSGAGGTSFGSNHYSMGVDYANGSWSSPNYSDLIIGYHTGIRLGASYTGIRFYNNSPTTDTNNTGNGNGGEALIMTVGGTQGSHVNVQNNLTVGANATISGETTISGGANGIKLNNSDIRSAQSNPTWTGNPGTVGKIQYHSNRWYIVADQSSNRIVQFRRDGADKSYIDNNGDLQSGKAAGWITSRTLSLTGAVTGSVSWDGTGNASLSTSFNDNGPNYIDVATGNYGTVKVDDDRGVAWAGYAIRDDWVFMSSGVDQSGIYNDTDNEWGITFHRNADTRLYHNGLESMRTVSSTGIRIGVPTSNSSDIYMTDSDEGERRIHCNSNRIGFLNSSNGWGAYCEDAGHWVVAGNITASGNVNSQSDVRVKENIEPISDAMQKVQSINGVTFNRNDLDDTETRYVGVIAQDVEAVLPEAVSENDEGIKQVAYGNMVGLLIEAIKEQQTQIDDLKAEIQSMKS